MKNIIEISQEGEQLISSIDINENTLYINNTLIPESQYIGSGTYTTTVEGHSISIVKVPNNTGNIQLVRLDEYSYSLKKTDVNVLDHLSIDENGYLKISDMYFNTPYDAGYILDQYGNFIHSRDIATDNWNIQDNNGTPHIKAYYETGKIFTDDALVTEDNTGFEYPLIWDNGANLWIGSTATVAKHHTGQTYISSGYSGTNGNESIFVSVPNANNTGATNYKVWHEGNLPTPIPINKGGTGKTSAAEAFKALSGYTLDLGTNNTTSTWVPVLNGSTIQHRVIPTNILNAGQFAKGYYSFGTVNKQTIKTSGVISFGKTFSATPIVVVGLSSSSEGYGMGNVSVSAFDITTTGFKARCFNNDTTSNSRSPGIYWIAINI